MEREGPCRVRLDACSMCQLKCPSCGTPGRKNDPGTIGWGYLRSRDFKGFIDNNPQITEIELSNQGEIFLNPELEDIIRYAYERGIILTADNGVNLNHIGARMIRTLVVCRFARITVSIDGGTSDTYVMYRREGNFRRVLRNILKLNRCKRELNSQYPSLRWQFVIFGHNEHEIPVAREMAKRLNMEFITKLSWDPFFSPIKDRELVRRESGLGVSSRREYRQKYHRYYRDPCINLWEAPVINWDGRLLGCCKNEYRDFGVNVFESGLEACLNHQRYKAAKEMLLRKKEMREDVPCTYCHIYRKPLGKSSLDEKRG